ncbi:hypothetical protein COEREDRAFT_79902 [Coemansia reversa NRRL 1564]|uniref:Uncharacterized protein n=1 Tax=Coemansia reversa (strain ATCC 12441 / NRRL 1564) TaxID=763665 RepID=A0A2G5BHJ1_COERN|nr:hypothetical protein COEREDRAFT_79902 [Coemansia reversa NRRL 1564]|eukprot:PIA18442.1 hypothetical protein COEREDRAFT_79902 [Coemansia reversa NRRL 1564]
MPAQLASMHTVSKTGGSLVPHLKMLHQKASRALILGQSSTAWEHSRVAVQHCNIEQLTCEYGEQQARQLCCRLWILYICVLSSLAELAEEDGRLRVRRGSNTTENTKLEGFPASVRDVWDSIMAAFGGYAGNVDSEVLVPTVLLCLKLRDARTARDIVEAWLATLSDETVYLLRQEDGAGSAQRQQQRTMAKASYLRVCELYMLHILPQLNDFSSAYDFLNLCTVVSEPARDEFTRRLDLLRNPVAVEKKIKKGGTRRKSRKQRQARQPTTCQNVLPTALATCAADNNTKSLVRKDAGITAASYPWRQKGTDHQSVPEPVGEQQSTEILINARRPTDKSGVVAHRPRNMLSVLWNVVQRLMGRWGFTLFTLAISIAVLRLAMQNLRLPSFRAIYRKLWATIKMGTQVTYI